MRSALTEKKLRMNKPAGLHAFHSFFVVELFRIGCHGRRGMVCKWTGLRSSKAEVMVNHMDNRQFKFPYFLSKFISVKLLIVPDCHVY